MPLSLKGINWPEKIDVLIRLFFYILAFWLPYSPAVIESCVITGVILWLIKRTVLAALGGGKNILNAFRPPESILNRTITFFLFVCVLSVTSSVLWPRALSDFINKFLEWFVVFWLVQESFKERRQILLLLGIFLFTSAAVAVDGILQYHLLGKDIFNATPLTTDGRATAGFHAPGSLGGYTASVIPLSLSMIFVSARKWLKLLLMVLTGSLIWTLMLTFTRGAWAGGFIGILVFFFTFFLMKRNFEMLKTFSVAALFIVLTLLFPLLLNMESTLKLVNRSNTISWRIHVWEDTWPMIKDRPLFGHGVNTYMPIFQAYRRDPINHPTYAHNCYVQLAAEVGLLGLAAFVAIFYKLFVDSFHRLRIMKERDPTCQFILIGLMGSLSAYLSHSFFDTNIYSLQLGVLLWFLVAILTKWLQIIKETESLHG